MGQIKKTDGLPSELSVEVLLRGVLTLEQGESETVFKLLKKGLENLVKAQQIKNSVAKEFKRRKKTEQERVMKKMQKKSPGYYGHWMVWGLTWPQAKETVRVLKADGFQVELGTYSCWRDRPAVFFGTDDPTPRLSEVAKAKGREYSPLVPIIDYLCQSGIEVKYGNGGPTWSKSDCIDPDKEWEYFTPAGAFGAAESQEEAEKTLANTLTEGEIAEVNPTWRAYLGFKEKRHPEEYYALYRMQSGVLEKFHRFTQHWYPVDDVRHHLETPQDWFLFYYGDKVREVYPDIDSREISESNGYKYDPLRVSLGTGTFVLQDKRDAVSHNIWDGMTRVSLRWDNGCTGFFMSVNHQTIFMDEDGALYYPEQAELGGRVELFELPVLIGQVGSDYVELPFDLPNRTDLLVSGRWCPSRSNGENGTPGPVPRKVFEYYRSKAGLQGMELFQSLRAMGAPLVDTAELCEELEDTGELNPEKLLVALAYSKRKK